MKKTISILLAVIILFSSLSVLINAENGNYSQPFNKGEQNSETYRIPAIITLKNGSVLAAADKRYLHGSDAPNNIDTIIAKSDDGYQSWSYSTINYFGDYSDGTTGENSASFIDSAIIQSEKSNRIFIITDAFPSGIGYNQAKKGSGYVSANGKQCLTVTAKDSSQKLKDYEYYIGDFKNGYAGIYNEGNLTSYSVDEEYNLYKDGKALYIAQVNSDKSVQQNIFYFSSDYHVYPTSYLWLRYSDDNGTTWSSPKILNGFVKDNNEKFLGIGPGRGAVVTVGNNERIIFTVYNNKGISEHTSTIYSDDNGVTWNRGTTIKYRIALGKTSEAQIVNLPDNKLMMFARNSSNYIAYSLSSDGGITWDTMQADLLLKANANCMVSFISAETDNNGNTTILGSYVSDTSKRANGVICRGTADKNGNIKWLGTYHVNNDFFAYSCLTQLKDGRIGYLYEDEAAHIQYKILSVTNGNISEINGDNCEYTEELKQNKLLNSIEKVFHNLKLL